MAKDEKKNKVGVVLVTHTDYGSRLLKAAEFIVGPQEDPVSISVDGSHEVEQTIDLLSRSVDERDQGAGVIVLTDMFGGTPTNLSLSLLGGRNIEVVTGVNLPMLLKVLGSRETPLDTLAADAKAAGLQGIVVAGEMLRSKARKSD